MKFFYDTVLDDINDQLYNLVVVIGKQSKGSTNPSIALEDNLKPKTKIFVSSTDDNSGWDQVKYEVFYEDNFCVFLSFFSLCYF